MEQQTLDPQAPGLLSADPSSDIGLAFDPRETGQPVASPDQQQNVDVGDDSSDVQDPLWPAGHPSQGQQTGDVPPKKNPSRFEYWQSRASQLDTELKQRENALQEVQPYIPIVQYLQQNPQLLERLASELDGQPASVQGPSSAQPLAPAAEPQVLSRPIRPANYDPTEAVTDPNSESFKYREALLSYQEQLAAHIESREIQRAQAEREAALEAQRQQLYRQQLIQTQTSLQAQFGFSQEEALDFIRTMSDPRTLQLEGMVRYYRALKGSSAPSKAAPAPSRQNLLRMPVPPTAGGGQSQVAMDDETQFNMSLLQESVPPWKRGQGRK